MQSISLDLVKDLKTMGRLVAVGAATNFYQGVNYFIAQPSFGAPLTAAEQMKAKIMASMPQQKPPPAPVATAAPVAAPTPVEQPDEPMEQSVSAADVKWIEGLATVLNMWVKATDGSSQKPTHFHSGRAPQLSIGNYLARLHKYFCATNECYVLALVYMDRVSKIDPNLALSLMNAHRLLATCAMVAAKYNDDAYYSNSYYAKVGGLTLKELNMLEARLIKLLDWKLLVSPEEYQLYHDLVCQANRSAQ